VRRIMSVYCVIGLMICAGVLGGLVNYGLTRSEQTDWRGIFWSVLIGVAAALLMPLFLNTISSSLLTGILEGKSKSSDIYVYFGFCLLGAIASKSMIQTLTDKVLRTAEEAKDKVDKLENNFSPILIKETEPENDQPKKEFEEIRASGDSFHSVGYVGDDVPKIIKALGNSMYSRRTVNGISKESGVAIEETVGTLDWLQRNGLAFTTGAPQHYWSLTQEGRSTFSQLIQKDS